MSGNLKVSLFSFCVFTGCRSRTPDKAVRPLLFDALGMAALAAFVRAAACRLFTVLAAIVSSGFRQRTTTGFMPAFTRLLYLVHKPSLVHRKGRSSFQPVLSKQPLKAKTARIFSITYAFLLKDFSSVSSAGSVNRALLPAIFMSPAPATHDRFCRVCKRFSTLETPDTSSAISSAIRLA